MESCKPASKLGKKQASGGGGGGKRRKGGRRGGRAVHRAIGARPPPHCHCTAIHARRAACKRAAGVPGASPSVLQLIALTCSASP